MGTNLTDITISNRNARIKTFLIRSAIAMAVCLFITIVFAVWKITTFNDPIENDLKTVGTMVAIGAGISIVIGLYYSFKVKDVCVRIIKDRVEVNINKAHGIYPLEDYKGFQSRNNPSSRFTAYFDLIFENKEDPESDLLIEVPVNAKLFMEISDSINIARHEMYGDDEEYTALEGDEYTRTNQNPFSIKTVAVYVIAFIISCGVIALTASMNVNELRKIMYTAIEILVDIFIIIILILSVRLKIKEKKHSVTSLRFDATVLKINGRDFPYKDIESITMTPPYLHHFSAYYRELSVKLYDSPKPVIFYVGNRPDDEKQEEPSEGSSCKYPDLYARVKSDRNLERKFRPV